MVKKSYLAKMLKEAGFRYPRIAWDSEFEDYLKINGQIDIFKDAGYNAKEILKSVKELKTIEDKIKLVKNIGIDYWIPDLKS